MSTANSASPPSPTEILRWADVRWLALIALGYASTLKLALFIPDAAGVLAAVWPPGGVALAALLLSPQRQRRAILATIFLTGSVVNLLSGRPALASVGFMVANLLESWGCAWLFARWCGTRRVTFARIDEVLVLTLGAVAVNSVTALLGATAALLAISASFAGFYLSWWISDGLGILLVTPLIVVCAQPWRRLADHWPRQLEAAALGVVWCGFSHVGFMGAAAGLPVVARPYWMCVPLVWAALRFGTRVTVVLLTLLAAIAVWLTVSGRGEFPLGGRNPVEQLQMVQLYLGVIILTGLTLAAAVAERNEQSEKMGELNRDFISFLENTSDFVYFKDATSRFRFCSQTLANITGHANWRDMIGKHDFEVFPKDTAQIYNEEELPIFRDGRPLLNKTDPYYDSAGNTRWVSTNKWPLLDREGKIVGLFGISRDITERRRAQQELQESQARLVAAMDQAHLAHWEMDAATATFNFNDRFYSLYGTTAEREGGYQMSAEVYAREFLPPEEQHIVAPDVARLLAGEIDELQAEHRIRRRDGEIRHLLVRITTVRDVAGRVLGTRGTNQDITERRRAEHSLRESEEKFRQLAENISDVFWITSPDFSTLHYVSAAYERIWGQSAARLFTRPHQWFSAILPEERERVMAAFATLAGNETEVSVEYRIARLDGSLRWISDRAFQVRDAKGKVIRLAGIARDITDQVQQQMKVRDLLAQTEQDSRTKGELLKEVNHRVTNNLTAVLGLLVHEKEFASGSERSVMAPALDRLQQRIRGLLQVHRMLAHSAWAPVGLDKLAREIIQAALSAAPWRHQAVVTVKPSALKVSPRQAGGIALVLNELTTNTVKYAGQPSQAVTISLEAESHEEWTTICYRDNGPGYPAEVTAGQRTNVGLRLLNEIVTKTLRGSLVLSNDQGAVAVIRVQLEDENRT